MTLELIQVRLEEYSPSCIAASIMGWAIMGGVILLCPPHNLQLVILITTITAVVYHGIEFLVYIIKISIQFI